MKRNLIFLLTFLSLSMVFTHQLIAADTKSAVSTAQLAGSLSVENKADHRAKVLKVYLQKRNSPLADYASVFIANADKYDLDWKLVAAISGVESTFGKNIPANSYNGWGWGIYGDHVLYFPSWDIAIATISQGIRENYLNRGAEGVYGIGRTYAASTLWASHVTSVMNDIDAFEKNWTDTTLSLTL